MICFIVLVFSLISIAIVSPLDRGIVEGRHAKGSQFPYQIPLRASGRYNCSCRGPLGRRSIGEHNANEGQFPYLVSIRIYGAHNCGGTILNKRWILTAAHCIVTRAVNSITIVFGSIKLNKTNARVYNVLKTDWHTKWNQTEFVYDIGLVHLTKDIEFGVNVQPLKLNTEDTGGDVDLTISVWAPAYFPGEIAEVLQFLTLKSITNEECAKNYIGKIIPSHICTYAKVGEGTCRGDSGGPLVYNGKVAGILSFGRPCGLGYPDVSTRVSSFSDWILARIN